MNKAILSLFFLLAWMTLPAQEHSGTVTGKISYVTAGNVYVKFESTEQMTKGDTLFRIQEDTLVPSLVIREISSISCVCVPLETRTFTVGEQFSARAKKGAPAVAAVPAAGLSAQSSSPGQDSAKTSQSGSKKTRPMIVGNVSVASYLNFSDVLPNSQRMKYTVALAAQNIGGTNLSADIFITFAHKLDNWTEIKSDVFNGLKIYSLSIDYRFNDHHRVWFGRHINPRIASVGAIDGLQYEGRAGAFTFGVIGGTRPDYTNYSFSASLFQLGGYVGHDYSNLHGNMQTTLAFINQTNSGNTDRRFAYLQHVNALIKNLFFFGSVEVDLYKKTMNPVDTVVSKDTTYSTSSSPTLSNLYLSLRYRPVRQVNLSVSYSARQNVIYYESYKNIVDRLLEQATVQGFMVQASYQPVSPLIIGVNAGYRSSKKDPRPSKNVYGYVTYSRIPGINTAATLSATWLESAWMSGKIFSAGLNRDFWAGRLSAGLTYRYVSYSFYSGEGDLPQNMGEINLTWKIMKKLYFGAYYEGTFDKSSTFNRVYLNLTQRF